MITEYEKQKIDPELLFSAVKAEIAEGRKALFTVTGMSMWPFICHGRDQVIVESCDPASLQVGDIVLFQTSFGNYILHRITSLKNNAFETTGDGNIFRDGWFSKDCVIARVESIVRKGRIIRCHNKRWRVLFSIWMFMFPVRKLIIHLLKRIGRAKAKIRKWKKY